MPYVRLLTTLLPEIGSGNRTYAQNLDYIHAHTGGIGASCSLHIQVDNPKTGKPSLNIRGKALRRKMDKLFTLMRETLEKPRFEEKKRIEELIRQMRDTQLHRLSRQALRYATQLSLSGFSSASHIAESWYGLRYYKTMEALAKDPTKTIPELIEKLLRLKEQLFTFHHPQLILSCSKEMLEEVQKENLFGLCGIAPSASCSPWDIDHPVEPISSQARVIASQVACTSEAFQTVAYLHPYAPALMLAALLFDHKVLHRKIRETGGAYGCGATYHPDLGHFHFHAYRDPHLCSSLEAFRLAIEEIAAGHFTEEDVTEAKLGIIQHLDSPLAPGNRALTAYCWMRSGKNQQIRQQFRDRLLNLTAQNVRHAVATELLPKIGQGVIVAFAGQELLERENKLLATKYQPLPILRV